jgi:hypothetical protein
MCLSPYRRLCGVLCGLAQILYSLEGPFLFGLISTTRERTRSPDTPAPRLSHDLYLFWGFPEALGCHWPWITYALGSGEKPADFRAVCVPNERTNLLLGMRPWSVPTSLVRYFCLELFLQTAQDLEEKSPHIAVSFPSLPLASSRLPSPRVPSALLSEVLAFEC